MSMRFFQRFSLLALFWGLSECPALSAVAANTLALFDSQGRLRRVVVDPSLGSMQGGASGRWPPRGNQANDVGVVRGGE